MKNPVEMLLKLKEYKSEARTAKACSSTTADREMSLTRATFRHPERPSRSRLDS